MSFSNATEKRRLIVWINVDMLDLRGDFFDLVAAPVKNSYLVTTPQKAVDNMVTGGAGSANY